MNALIHLTSRTFLVLMCLALNFNGSSESFYDVLGDYDREDFPSQVVLELPHNVNMEFLLVPSGMFAANCIESKKLNGDNEYYETYVSEFYISKFETTNSQWQEFISAGGYDNEKYWKEGWRWRNENNISAPVYWQRISKLGDYEILPVRYISYFEAAAFAEWLSEYTGYCVEIPTCTQWEYAASGADNYEQIKLFPWGDYGNNGYADAEDMLATNSGYYGSDTDTTPHVAAVGTFYKDLSWCGAYDMAGNVSEWSRLDSRAYLRSGSYALGSAVCNELDNYGKSVTGLFFSTSHSTPANKEFRRYCVGIRYVIAIASDLEQ